MAKKYCVMLSRSNVNGPPFLVSDLRVEAFTISSLNMMLAIGCIVNALNQIEEVHCWS